jgi:hypothetical protein
LLLLLSIQFGGFAVTNPCEQLSGERSTHLVPKLGLGDERLHPHHSTLITYPPIDSEKQQGRTVQEFLARAHHYLKESLIQLIRRVVGHSNTWVLLAGSQPSL